MGRISTRELSGFVENCDKLGGVAHPDASDYISDFSLQFESRIDQELDPFGAAYFDQQSALYTEISGRLIDQEIGEISPINVDYHASGINPYHSDDLAFMSRHVRAVSTAMMIANLPPNAQVLDVGSGWGLSSEIIAFCGGQVTSVDINPLFVDLVARRSVRLGLPITAVQGNFDDLQTDRKFDVAFFYECLHHALRPWVTVGNIGRHLSPGGKIIFAGEPIYGGWKNWGIRLDALSVYCVRKFGWFESGWSSDFIVAAFQRAGFDLQLIPGVGLENGAVGVASKLGERTAFNLNLLHPSTLLKGEIADQQKLIEALKADVISWKDRAEGLKGGVEQRDIALADRMAALLSSRSWKLTSPLRKVARLLGRN